LLADQAEEQMKHTHLSTNDLHVADQLVTKSWLLRKYLLHCWQNLCTRPATTTLEAFE
jgi:hypothetical protein